jgi:predicted DsbA family dithiol-disulfide isomerase
MMTAAAPTVIAYYDFTCPLCYISSRRAELIGKELGLDFEWREFEGYPNIPKKGRALPHDEEGLLFYTLSTWAAEIDLPINLPKLQSNSNLALRGSSYAKNFGRFAEYKKAVYSAYWVAGKDIGKLEVLSNTASDLGLDGKGFERFVSSGNSRKLLRSERRKAENMGIEFIPTFVFGSERVIGNKSLSAFKECLESYVEIVSRYSSKDKCSESACGILRQG